MTNEELKALQARLNALYDVLRPYGEHPPQELLPQVRESADLLHQLMAEVMRRKPELLFGEQPKDFDVAGVVAALLTVPEQPEKPMTDDELKAAHIRLKELFTILSALQGEQPSPEIMREYMLLTTSLFNEVQRRDPVLMKALDERCAAAAPGTQVGFDLEGTVGRLVRRAEGK